MLLLLVSSSRFAASGAYAAPTVKMDVVLVLMVTVSKEVIVGCVVCSTEILLYVAISTPPLGLFPSLRILSFWWYSEMRSVSVGANQVSVIIAVF